MIKGLRAFLRDFDFSNPDWSQLPEGFPKCDLGGLDSEEVGKFSSIVSLWELSRPPKPKSRSRVWQDPKGFQYLGVWQNAALLRVLTLKFTLTFPFAKRRLKDHMDDAARSTKRNIEEGWKRPTTSAYLEFLGYSQASLEELKGDVRDARTDGLLKSRPGSTLADLGIDLRVIKGPSKGRVKGEPTEPGHPYFKPLKTLRARDLTFEIFTELINKTDFLLRRLVESLEKKLEAEQKGWEVEKARIKGRVKGKI